MAVGGVSSLILGAGAFSTATQIGAGNSQAKAIQKQAEYNAQIYNQQGTMILEKKKIQDYQFLRNSADARGGIVSATAGKGLLMGGSPLAILIDSESQMQFDKAIQDYNTQVDYNYTVSGANNTRLQGAYQSQLARSTGYSNAFSTMLNTGAQIGMLNLRPGQGGKI